MFTNRFRATGVLVVALLIVNRSPDALLRRAFIGCFTVPPDDSLLFRNSTACASVRGFGRY